MRTDNCAFSVEYKCSNESSIWAFADQATGWKLRKKMTRSQLNILYICTTGHWWPDKWSRRRRIEESFFFMGVFVNETTPKRNISREAAANRPKIYHFESNELNKKIVISNKKGSLIAKMHLMGAGEDMNVGILFLVQTRILYDDAVGCKRYNRVEWALGKEYGAFHCYLRWCCHGGNAIYQHTWCCMGHLLVASVSLLRTLEGHELGDKGRTAESYGLKQGSSVKG